MNKQFIFVMGAGRSGTKFLVNILNNSAEIHLAPEIHYFSSLIHNGFLKNLKKYHKKGRLSIDDIIYLLQKVKHFGTYWKRTRKQFSNDDIMYWFQNVPINEKTIYQFIIEQDYKYNTLNKPGAKYIGEKTPSNIFHLGTLLKWFPDGIFFFIHRNPLDVLRSEVNQKRKLDYPIEKKNPLYSYGLIASVFYSWSASALIALYYNLKTNNIITVSYEDLILHKRDTVVRIAETIKIPYSDELCKVKRVGSSYSQGKHIQYWYPPKWVVSIYTFFLQPLKIKLNKISLKQSTLA